MRQRADLERVRAAYAGCGGCGSGAYGKTSVLASHRRTPVSSPRMDARRRFELGTGTDGIESNAADEIDVSFASKTLGKAPARVSCSRSPRCVLDLETQGGDLDAAFTQCRARASCRTACSSRTARSNSLRTITVTSRPLATFIAPCSRTRGAPKTVF